MLKAIKSFLLEKRPREKKDDIVVETCCYPELGECNVKFEDQNLPLSEDRRKIILEYLNWLKDSSIE